FEIPNVNRFVPPIALNLPNGEFDITKNEYVFALGSQITGEAFHFSIKRKSTGAILFDTAIGGFFYADKFMSLSSLLPSKNIYGLGENMHLSFRHNLDFMTWPTFGRDQPPSYGNEDGSKNLNLYGSHPFYECVENDGNTHGVFLFSASALDYQLLPYPGITFRTISGMLDFYVFLGPNPEDVVGQYTALIGRPTLVPYWSLGFQLSKYGYENIETMKQAVERTLDNGIPLDVQFLDIDHMENQTDFTISPEFDGIKDFIAETKATGLRWIPILDPAIDTERMNYSVHSAALEANIYFTWPNSSYVSEGTDYYDDYERLGNKSVMLGYVWPLGKAAFPNFLDEAAQQWWYDEIQKWKRESIDFDGLWIDMNEPANFDTNKIRPWNWQAQRPNEPDWNLHCPINEWDDPPYVTMAALWTSCGDEDNATLCSRRMSDKTLCMFAVHGDGDNILRHYDSHNLYGWAQSPITKRAAEDATGSRSLVISRSTFPSSGKYAGHWLGDNASIWPDMHRSIIGMLEFNLFGIPYVGADICGFFLNATEPLCNRWMQLGAFYPFSRNHNTYEGRPIPQDPGYWPDTVGVSSQRALKIRYRFLPYIYTLFYEAHIKGSTVVRPLFHEFPRDRRALTIDTQFLLGSAFLVSPILEEDAISREIYLPDELWYDFHSYKFEQLTGTDITVVPLDNFTIPLHLRGGYIFPVQEYFGNNTQHTRQQPLGLVITVGRERTAFGSLYWDNGDSLDPIGTEAYQLIEFEFSEDMIIGSVIHRDITGSVLEGLMIESVEIWGYEFEVSDVIVNGESNNFTIEGPGEIEFLQISGLSIDPKEDFTIVLTHHN
ncbi:hypothetical protein QYM36_008166, partial [Artemia franciscana]